MRWRNVRQPTASHHVGMEIHRDIACEVPRYAAPVGARRRRALLRFTAA
ncbi:hypothetical protein [Selenomonas sp. FOBRC9]|nr:hypothetical protein [Selenomonas sp. FOBRC9]